MTAIRSRLAAATVIKLAVKICSGGMACLSAICLSQVDVLSRAKDSALSSLDIG
jgi:hypothetical protein